MIETPRFNRPKLQVFSIISFALLCFIMVFADSFTLHQSISIQSKKNRPISSLKLFSVEENIQEQFKEKPHLIPPFNSTQKQRIPLFKDKLPHLDILESSNCTKQFDKRVHKFFGKNRCKVKFFMTWISPAKNFGEREFWSIDSLFKSNPDGCLMILSRTMDSVIGFNLLKPLLDRRFKIQAVSPELQFLFNNTPAEVWFDQIKKGEKDPGEIPLPQNLSNLIRLAVLYKYGGVYLDTDFIVLRDFSDLKNSIGSQSVDIHGNWTRLNNAVLVFDKNHPLLYRFIEEFASNFDGNKWGHNGPYLVTRVVERVKKDSPEINFTVLPPVDFYPVDWTKIAGLFLRPGSRQHRKWVEAKVVQLSGRTYGVHLWNKHSSKFKIEGGSIIDRLRLQHCIICNYNYTSFEERSQKSIFRID
ncbi:hypothetical protein LguiA_032100 [Lonicera macranthoides]